MALRDTPKFDIKWGYWPNTPSQWREPTVDDCTWYAGEFAFEASDIQHRSYHPVDDLRNKSADTTGGTTVQYMTDFLLDVWPSNASLHAYYGSFTKSDIIDRLRAGATFIVGGDYEKLPLHYRRWTTNDKFNHAVAIRFYDTDTERTAMYDPLGGGSQRSEYDGEWINLEALLTDYWWRGGDGWVAGVVGTYRKDEDVVPTIDEAGALQELRVKARTAVYNAPSAVAGINRRIWSDTKWWPTVARAHGGWYLIIWRDSDNNARRHGYVHRDDLLERRAIVPPEPSTPDQDLVAQVQNLQTEVDRLKAVSAQQLTVINTVRAIVNR